MAMLTKNFNQLQSEVQKHIATDQVVQGKYWDIEDNKGCLAHASNPKYLESQYGIPSMLTRISEAIFERLESSKQEHVKFFANFPDAVATDNKDLSLVSLKFLEAILEELPNQTPEIQKVIEGISQLADGGSWDEGDAWATAWAAFDAFDSFDATDAAFAAFAAAFAAAWAAAEAARDDAFAAAAAWAAFDAFDSFDAAFAARHAARDAAFAAVISYIPARRQAEILLQLIKEAPVV